MPCVQIMQVSSEVDGRIVETSGERGGVAAGGCSAPSGRERPTLAGRAAARATAASPRRRGRALPRPSAASRAARLTVQGVRLCSVLLPPRSAPPTLCIAAVSPLSLSICLLGLWL